MKIFTAFVDLLNRIGLVGVGVRDFFFAKKRVFLDEYTLVKQLITNCIDEDIKNPVPEQLLRAIPADDYHAFVNLYLALQILQQTCAGFEDEGFEVGERWKQALMACDERLFGFAYYGLTKSDRIRFESEHVELTNLVKTCVENSQHEALFDYKYTPKTYQIPNNPTRSVSIVTQTENSFPSPVGRIYFTIQTIYGQPIQKASTVPKEIKMNNSNAKFRYDQNMFIYQALDKYFQDTGYNIGSYIDEQFQIVLLGKTLNLPNPPDRQNAIRVHDLYHILTEYDTSFKSESWIGAFELGAGIPQSYLAAWFFNCTSTFLGLFHSPVKTFKAFMRGRATTDNLYRLIPYGDKQAYEEVMMSKVGVMRNLIGVNNSITFSIRDLLLITLASTVGALLIPVIGIGIAKAYLEALWKNIK